MLAVAATYTQVGLFFQIFHPSGACFIPILVLGVADPLRVKLRCQMPLTYSHPHIPTHIFPPTCCRVMLRGRVLRWQTRPR